MNVVVFGYGNPSRGDDAIGPFLLGRIDEDNHANITCIEDFQLQIDHALDLNEQDLALFIDAGIDTPAPFAFYEIEPTGELSHTSHALSPQTVLDVFVKINGKAPPPSFILCVKGKSFGLGEDISEIGTKNLEAAWTFLHTILANSNVDNWREKAQAKPTEEEVL